MNDADKHEAIDRHDDPFHDGRLATAEGQGYLTEDAPENTRYAFVQQDGTRHETDADGEFITPPVILTNEALIVRPGDTLLIRVDPAVGWDFDVIQETKREIRRRIPGLAEVVIVAAAEFAVYRPDPT